jgi:hypothetical protein
MMNVRVCMYIFQIFLSLFMMLIKLEQEEEEKYNEQENNNHFNPMSS